MGGRIEVESEKSQGSTFSFSIWVGTDEAEESRQSLESIQSSELQTPLMEEDSDNIKEYGTPENIETFKRNMSKLILCVEMENWEKAEMFMETIRQLTEGAPWEVSRKVLRLKMAIQKENYDKVIAEFEELNHLVEGQP